MNFRGLDMEYLQNAQNDSKNDGNMNFNFFLEN